METEKSTCNSPLTLNETNTLEAQVVYRGGI